ncbi:MAG: DUF4920 domain-containing protein [Polyangiales bacterium]
MKCALFAILIVGCTPQQATPDDKAAPQPKPPAAAPTSVMPASSGSSTSVYGKAVDQAIPFVALADIQKDPKAWQGKRVRTRGEVVAVCQAAGCWCDLKPEGGTAIVPTHVTMHDHAFLLPKNAKSKVAEIEGNLVVRELSQQEVDHYNGEGASLTAGTPVVNVDAVGVILR